MQPESAKTVLIISSLTPKSLRVSTGRPTAIASSAAVDETVTSPRRPGELLGHRPGGEVQGVGLHRPFWTRAA